METPEKIHIQPNAHDGWFEGKIPNGLFVEYTRTDAFIEKACKWLRKELVNFEDYSGMGEELISDFRKAMEE